MNIQSLLLQQTTIMFLLIGIGYGLTKAKLYKAESGKELSVLLIYVSFPSVVLDAFLATGREGMRDLGISFLMALIGLTTAIIVSFIVYRKKYPIEHVGTSFGNAGFMGLPLVSAVFGEQGVLYVTGVVVLLTLGQWTYGVMRITGSTEAIRIKKMLKNPVILASILGVILVYLPITLPEVIMQPIGFAKNLNTPLAMIVLGISLAQTKMLECVKKPGIYLASAVRLILIPLVTMVVYKMLPFNNREMLLALMVVFSTPIGSNVAIVAEMYEKDSQTAVQQVCFSTLLSIVTIPLIMGIVEGFL